MRDGYRQRGTELYSRARPKRRAGMSRDDPGRHSGLRPLTPGDDLVGWGQA